MMNEKAQKLVFEFYQDVGEYIKNEYHPKWFRHYTNEEFIVSVMESVKLYYFGGNTVTYRDWETDRKSTRLNSSHSAKSRMPSSA